MNNSLEFTYKLSYDEAYEAFYLLSMKWSKRARVVLGTVLLVIAVGMLAAYYLDSQKIHYFFMVILDILLLYYLIYVPVLKARRGADKVRKQNGTYKVRLTGEGKIKAGAEIVELAGDKDARAIETATIYVIRTDNVHTFCLPKRMMKEEETEEVRKILKSHMKYQYR